MCNVCKNGVGLHWCVICRGDMITFSSKQWRQINLSRKLSGVSHHNSGYGIADSRVSQPQPSAVLILSGSSRDSLETLLQATVAMA